MASSRVMARPAVPRPTNACHACHDFPCLPHRSVPRQAQPRLPHRAQPRRARPCLACLAVPAPPRQASPCHALPASPVHSTPSPATPRPASPSLPHRSYPRPAKPCLACHASTRHYALARCSDGLDARERRTTFSISTNTDLSSDRMLYLRWKISKSRIASANIVSRMSSSSMTVASER